MAQQTNEFDVLRSHLQLDDEGRLVLAGQHMILLPRHFLRYILREVNATAGPEAYRKIFHKAGHDGALTFCRRYREIHGCAPQEAVEAYLKEMSLRGWGHFTLLRLEPENAYLEVSLLNSALETEGDLPSGHVIWEGAMIGAMNFLTESLTNCSVEPLKVYGEMIPGDQSQKRRFRIIVSPPTARTTTP